MLSSAKCSYAQEYQHRHDALIHGYIRSISSALTDICEVNLILLCSKFVEDQVSGKIEKSQRELVNSPLSLLAEYYEHIFIKDLNVDISHITIRKDELEQLDFILSSKPIQNNSAGNISMFINILKHKLDNDLKLITTKTSIYEWTSYQFVISFLYFWLKHSASTDKKSHAKQYKPACLWFHCMRLTFNNQHNIISTLKSWLRGSYNSSSIGLSAIKNVCKFTMQKTGQFTRIKKQLNLWFKSLLLPAFNHNWFQYNQQLSTWIPLIDISRTEDENAIQLNMDDIAIFEQICVSEKEDDDRFCVIFVDASESNGILFGKKCLFTTGDVQRLHEQKQVESVEVNEFEDVEDKYTSAWEEKVRFYSKFGICVPKKYHEPYVCSLNGKAWYWFDDSCGFRWVPYREIDTQKLNVAWRGKQKSCIVVDGQYRVEFDDSNPARPAGNEYKVESDHGGRTVICSEPKTEIHGIRVAKRLSKEAANLVVFGYMRSQCGRFNIVIPDEVLELITRWIV